MGAQHSATNAEFTSWVEHNQSRLLKQARVICFDFQNADDVLQETLVDIYQHWPKVRMYENLNAYAVRIMVSKHADLRRKWARRQVEKESTLDIVDLVLQQEDNSDVITERLLVQSALKSLTPAQRAVLVLIYDYGYSIREASGVLDMPTGTIASHLARGRDAVAKFVTQSPRLSAPRREALENNLVQGAQIIEDAEVIEP